tara:strand:+ start:602 stop:757 length:156 start_codon:yes stop_codon:yes gene_type:complete
VVQKQQPEKIKQRSAKEFMSWLSDGMDSRDSVSDFSYEGFCHDSDTDSYDP